MSEILLCTFSTAGRRSNRENYRGVNDYQREVDGFVQLSSGKETRGEVPGLMLVRLTRATASFRTQCGACVTVKLDSQQIQLALVEAGLVGSKANRIPDAVPAGGSRG